MPQPAARQKDPVVGTDLHVLLGANQEMLA
jgi:hypothetical protein